MPVMKQTGLVVMIVCLSASVLAQGQGRGAGAQQDFGQPQPARQVTVTAIPGVVAAGAQWTQAWAGTDNADGIVGTPDGGLLFAQEQPKRISKLNANNRVSVYAENTNGAGSVALDARGRLVAAQRTCTDP